MGKVLTPEERSEQKAQRIQEKLMRMPVNDVVLQVQKGTISLESVFKKIEERVRGGK